VECNKFQKKRAKLLFLFNFSLSLSARIVVFFVRSLARSVSLLLLTVNFPMTKLMARSCNLFTLEESAHGQQRQERGNASFQPFLEFLLSTSRGKLSVEIKNFLIFSHDGGRRGREETKE
jgi:hypothetical protein